jgi:hypothetical protein
VTQLKGVIGRDTEDSYPQFHPQLPTERFPIRIPRRPETDTLMSAMKRSPTQNELELAVGWSITRVEGHLNAAEKDALIAFVSQRYEERFLDPIRTLRLAPHHSRGYGFAIMALCSLLIESLQSYRYGLPTTNAGEFDRLASFNPPPEFEIPPKDQKSGTQVFSDFFSYAPHQRLFPNVLTWQGRMLENNRGCKSPVGFRE